MTGKDELITDLQEEIRELKEEIVSHATALNESEEALEAASNKEEE